MSDVIRFLETLGSNPSFAKLSAAEYAATVSLLSANDGQRQALLNRDHLALNDLLGGRHKLMCVIFPADDEEQKDDDQRDDEPAKETPPESE